MGYLIFNNSFLNHPQYDHVFTTEGHPLPIVPELRQLAYSGRETSLKPRLRHKACPLGLPKARHLGKFCSGLDVRLCPLAQKYQKNETMVESSCHVRDKLEENACRSHADCGTDSGNCRERMCSTHGF